MAHPGRRQTFAARLVSLRAHIDAGDASAWWELGCLLDDGDVDTRGRMRVAPNPRGAFAAFRRGASLGDAGALLNLGVCYDLGRGTRRDRGAAWRCYQGVWRRTHDAAAAHNLATWHRDGGNQRLAFSWYEKAADAGDGDAHVDLADSHYYGLGTKPNVAHALATLDRAERAAAITPYGREEMSYTRAIMLLDHGRRGDIPAAETLLRRATADGGRSDRAHILGLALGAVVGGLLAVWLGWRESRRHWPRR